MKSSYTYFFMPVFLFIYFTLSYIPLFKEIDAGEIFPFFSFKLYSKIPSSYERYDILLNHGEAEKRFLFLGNKDLNEIEEKFYKMQLGKVQALEKNTETQHKLHVLNEWLKNNNRGELVKIYGDCIDIASKNQFQIDIIK